MNFNIAILPANLQRLAVSAVGVIDWKDSVHNRWLCIRFPDLVPKAKPEGNFSEG